MNQDTLVQNVERGELKSLVVARPSGGLAVTAVERVLDIFEAFHKVQKPLSLTDLAELTGIPKSSCHAIVGTLTA